jgi:hypothetical protein
LKVVSELASQSFGQTPRRSSNLLGSLEHAVELFVGRALPLVRNRREAALLPFRLEGEPSVDPLFAERHTELLVLTPALGDMVELVASAPLGSLRND